MNASIFDLEDSKVMIKIDIFGPGKTESWRQIVRIISEADAKELKFRAASSCPEAAVDWKLRCRSAENLATYMGNEIARAILGVINPEMKDPT